MRKVSLLTLLCCSFLLWSQAPQGMNYQSIVKNASGDLVSSSPIGLEIQILQGSVSGTIVYEETHNISTNTNGLLTLVIGQGTTSGDFSSIDWANGPFFVKTNTDPDGGTNYSISGTTELLSVPYALYATNGLTDGNVAGDLLFWTGSTWTELPIGQEGEVLTVGTGGQLEWSSIATSNSSATIFTSEANDLTLTSATLGGNLLNNGGSPATSKGICYGLSPNPTLENNDFTDEGSGTGIFSSSITGLSLETQYYARAYVINSDGIKYGSEITFSTLGLEVGTPYEGGIIAYVFQDGEPGYVAGEVHGLIAATTNQSTGIKWGTNGIDVTTSEDLGTGLSNTQAIITANTGATAATVCSGLILNGFSDWYLPSYDELDKLYINRDLIGGFTDVANYWSSSQGSADNRALVRLFPGGNRQNFNKQFTGAYVRAVRSF